MRAILDWLFRCGHGHTTFPITPERRSDEATKKTYVVCLDCGREFDYDWRQMRVGAARKAAA